MEKIISLNFLISNILISKHNKVVLVTGCFDIFHSGHKAFLKAAKKQGDVLIVGLELDKRVRKLKGKDRPINSWKKRVKELAALSAVDFVFPLPEKFDSPKDHLKLLQLIRPKILAVSENTPNLEKKRKLIEKIGGKLFVYPFNPKYSTTKSLRQKTGSFLGRG